MSKPTLTQNLQTIYTVKNQIKKVIGTDSDLFTEYPSIIEEAIQGGGSGESVDILYDTPNFDPEMVGETVPYVSTIIGDNFQVHEKGGNIDSIEYEYTQDDGKGGTWKILVSLNADPNNLFADSGNLDFSTYPDLYGNVFPIVANAVVKVSEDPKNYDYHISGDLYTWNLMDNANEVETITENGFVVNNGAAGYDVQVQGGPVQGVPANVFVSVRPGLSGNSNYPYFSPNEMEDGALQIIDTSAFVPFADTYDAGVQVHTLISDNFHSWGIDPNNFVSSIRNFVASDWDNGKVNPLSDLTCTTMVQEGNSSSECWCLVEGTLQNATDVCFKSDSGSWDSMGNQWMMDSNETLLECMPVVQKYKDPMSPYGWSTSKTQDGTYISLPAGPVKLYLHYQEYGDASNCDVYYCVYDSLNSQWTAKWYNMAETGAMTFVNPSANE